MTDGQHEEREDDLALPGHLTDEARDLIVGVLDDLDGAEQEPDAYLWGGLMQAGELISTADRLDAVARDAGYMTEGSQGQQVLHPATAEARQCRSVAAKTITDLRPKPETRHKYDSHSARQAAATRWRRARGAES